jgi:dTDP-D-glucose 4,6-dehydratase
MADTNTFPKPILITGGAGFLGSGYQMDKSFTKSQQGIHILKRITSD